MTASLIVPDVWSLTGESVELERAGILWQNILRKSGQPIEEWDRQATATVPVVWNGSAASAYASHRKRVAADVTAAQQLAASVGKALTGSAEAVRVTTERLTEEFHQITTAVPVDDREVRGKVVFRPADAAQAAKVRAAVAAARTLQAELSRELAGQAERIRTTLTGWHRIGDSWRDVAAGGEPFQVPQEGARTFVLRDGNRVVISAGTGDDDVRVYLGTDGKPVVEVNGAQWALAPDAEVVVRTGDGNDTVSVAPGMKVHLAVLGGDGNDAISGDGEFDRLLGLDGDDRIRGGAGLNVMAGGAGRDYLEGGRDGDVIDGGSGEDTIYGQGGADLLAGGDDRDFMDGGLGGDDVDGGAGADVISGGGGDDRLIGRGEADVFYTGAGRDTVDGGGGSDTAYLTAATDTSAGVERAVTVDLRDVGREVQVEGSPEFVARVQSDLDLLRSSPDGQRMLAALDEGVRSTGAGKLTIQELLEDNGYASGSVIGYNPTYSTLIDSTPPAVVLFHEMAHQFDFTHDTTAPGYYDNPADPDVNIDMAGHRWLVPNAEREAVGLPIDDDGEPSTPYRIDPDHPLELTENGLRAEFGWPRRERYSV